MSAAYFDNYDLPSTIRVEADYDGEPKIVALRKARQGDVLREVQIFSLPAMRTLPVPDLIAAPACNERGEAMCLLSVLPGRDLQKLSMGTVAELAEAKKLLVEAVLGLHALTSRLQQDSAGLIPARHQEDVISALETAQTERLADPLCQRALATLKLAFKTASLPLVFTNGDIQPGNFLASHGKLSGFIDFEKARFEDPLMGWAKYPLDDLAPLNDAGVVELFLEASGYSAEQLRLRIALEALVKLNRLPRSVDCDEPDYVARLRAAVTTAI